MAHVAMGTDSGMGLGTVVSDEQTAANVESAEVENPATDVLNQGADMASENKSLKDIFNNVTSSAPVQSILNTLKSLGSKLKELAMKALDKVNDLTKSRAQQADAISPDTSNTPENEEQVQM